MKIFKLVLLTLLITSVSACGWQLRGNIDLPDELRIVAINPDESYTSLQRVLRTLLTASGVTVVPIQDSPGAIIQLINDDLSRRSLTTSLAGDVTENLLVYTIQFQVTDAMGNILIPPTSIRTEGTALYNPSDLLGTAEAENIILDDLRFDAVNQLIQRYAATPLYESQSDGVEDNRIEPSFEPESAIQ